MKPIDMIRVEEVFALEARTAELFKRIKRGDLDIDDALVGVQGILEHDYPFTVPYIPPTWYVSPERQLERARQLNAERDWGFVSTDFPDAVPPIQLSGTSVMLKQLKRKLRDSGRNLDYDPLRFHNVPDVELTDKQILMLGIYLPEKGDVGGIQRTFDEQFAVIKEEFASRGIPVINGHHYNDKLGEAVKSDPEHLRLFDREHQPGIRWVVYDFDAYNRWYPGYRATDLWQEGATGLAASEVLSAMVLFPEYMPSSSARLPNLSGYQCWYDSGWSRCPTISIFPVKIRPGEREEVFQTAIMLDDGGSHCSLVTPVVRELVG